MRGIVRHSDTPGHISISLPIRPTHYMLRNATPMGGDLALFFWGEPQALRQQAVDFAECLAALMAEIEMMDSTDKAKQIPIPEATS